MWTRILSTLIITAEKMSKLDKGISMIGKRMELKLFKERPDTNEADRRITEMNKVWELLQEPDTVVLFDVDGTLTSYNYGEYHAHHELDFTPEFR